MTEKYQVPVGQIESKLAELWESFEGTNKMRACLFNLVMFVPKDTRVDYFRSVAQKVIKKFPSRIVVVEVDRTSSQDQLTATVSAMLVSEGECDIACDLIELNTTPSSLERIPFVLLPLTVPDLPTYLVWAEDPCYQASMLNTILPYTTRVIFDSEAASDLIDFAQLANQIYTSSKIDIADLNWGRLESWRDLVVATFKRQGNLDFHEKIQRVAIRYNASETAFFCHTQIQSLYFQAWLASQLNWKYESKEKSGNAFSFFYKNNSEDVRVDIESCISKEFAPGMICSLEIETHDGCHISFSPTKEDPQNICIRTSTSESCEVPAYYHFTKEGSGQSLVKEICHKGTSDHFLKVVKFLTTLKEKA